MLSRFSGQESALSGEEDAYTESSFQDVFNEDGIVLDPVSVLPLQYKITTNLLPLSGRNMEMCSTSFSLHNRISFFFFFEL